MSTIINTYDRWNPSIVDNTPAADLDHAGSFMGKPAVMPAPVKRGTCHRRASIMRKIGTAYGIFALIPLGARSRPVDRVPCSARKQTGDKALYCETDVIIRSHGPNRINSLRKHGKITECDGGACKHCDKPRRLWTFETS